MFKNGSSDLISTQALPLSRQWIQGLLVTQVWVGSLLNTAALTLHLLYLFSMDFSS